MLDTLGVACEETLGGGDDSERRWHGHIRACDSEHGSVQAWKHVTVTRMDSRGRGATWYGNLQLDHPEATEYEPKHKAIASEEDAKEHVGNDKLAQQAPTKRDQ